MGTINLMLPDALHERVHELAGKNKVPVNLIGGYRISTWRSQISCNKYQLVPDGPWPKQSSNCNKRQIQVMPRGYYVWALFRKIENLNTLVQGDCGASQGGTAMGNLPPEIERKLRNMDPEDMKKVTSFFCLVEAGDKRATEIWSMANDKEIEQKQVADLIYDYMDLKFHWNLYRHERHSSSHHT